METTGLERFQRFTEEVRDRTDLVQLLQEDGHKLERTSRGHKCLSPFRNETDGSFHVYDEGKSFYDFGDVDIRGDCFSYVMRRDGVVFKDAVATLAIRCGLTPYWVNGADHDDEYRTVIARLLQSRVVFEQLSEAAAYLHNALPSRIRKQLLDQWGITRDTVDKLMIGYGDETLIDHFVDDLDYDEEECLRTGLFIPRRAKLPDKLRPIDFFQHRIVFPYWVGGSVKYMIGRRTEFSSEQDYEKAKYKKLQVHNEQHKYVSEWIDNNVFYGEDSCRQKCPLIIIAEGITDCIAAIQHGFRAFSSVTTQPKWSMMDYYVKRASVGERVCIANDPDSAGEAGAVKMAAALYKAKQDVRIVDLPRGGKEKIDLCVFLRDQGPNKLSELLDKAKRLPEFILDRVPQNLSSSELEARLEPVLRVGGACGPIERDDFINRVAKRFGISKKAIGQKLIEMKVEAPEPEPKGMVQGAELTEPSASDSSGAPASSDSTSSSPTTSSSSGSNSAGSRSRISARGIQEPAIKGEIFEDVLVYYDKTPKGDVTLSSFVLTPKQCIVVEGKEHLQCDISWSGGTIDDFRFPPSAWNSRKGLIDALPTVGLTWTGTDDHVQGLRRIVSNVTVPVRIGTSTLGFRQTDQGNVWVTPSGIIDQNGFQTEPAIVYVRPPGDTLADKVEYTLHPREKTVALAQEVYPELLRLNEARIIVPVLGWFFATAFKSRIIRTLKHFPILMIHGTPGSGKTSLMKNVFWPLFGIKRNANAFSCRSTYHPMLIVMGSSTDLPLFFDELKYGDMKRNGRWETYTTMMRRSYDGESEERGHRDMSVTRYELSAPLAVAGETAPENDEALLERMVLVCSSKNALTTDRQAAYKRLQALPFEQLAGAYVQWTLGQDDAIEGYLKRARDLVLSKTSVSIPPRVKDNLIVVAFGLLVFDAWCAELGIRIPSVDLQEVFASLLDEIAGGEKGSAGQTRDSFDAFLESLSLCARNKTLTEGDHFAHINNHLHLHLESCYQVYLAERRKTDQGDETNGLRALRRRAREKMEEGSYVVAVDHQTSLDGGAEDRRTRCVVIDYARIPPALRIDRFPSDLKTKRTHGGIRRPQDEPN